MNSCMAKSGHGRGLGKPNKQTALQLSKKLSWILRHGATKEGLAVRADGFVSVAAILQHPKYGSDYTQELLEQIVATDNKQRFMLRRNEASNEWEIRANQGHSMSVVKSEECLERVTAATNVPMAVHGTYYRYWESIRKGGLQRLTRNHVHFATFDVLGETKMLSSDCGPMSGFRSDCEILIYLDLPKVLLEAEHGGMQLFRSANGVVLCAGIGETGCIPTKYFLKVIDRRTGQRLEY